MSHITITLSILMGAAIALGRASTLYAKCKDECKKNAGDVEEDDNISMLSTEISRSLFNLCLDRCTNEDHVRCRALCRKSIDSAPAKRKPCLRRCNALARDRCQEDCNYGGPDCLDKCINLYGYK
ncbi:hypothetical protein CSKR_114049 [Clonorchis sinensis]|uniref:Uncharacterized protein n=1 Tax=Clonorchis sinensis TaxID=79923 RepID=A0A8T1M058_CLOSI|nr:hypothetical protein CSKR_114049 [Clonorchis sinensis]